MRKRPNGGHGGAGGDVVIQADDRMQNLANATHHFKGGAGLNGMRTSLSLSLSLPLLRSRMPWALT